MPTRVLRGLLIPINDVDTGQQYDQTLSLFPLCMKCQRFRAAKKLSAACESCLSVRPSVRLSKRVHYDITEERPAQIFYRAACIADAV